MNIFCSIIHDTTGTSILLCLMGRCAWIGMCYTQLNLSLRFERRCKAYTRYTTNTHKFGPLGLATVTRIWRIYGGVLRVLLPYRQHDGRANCMAVFVRFMYG
jgi:hypothetical protein